MKEMLPLRPQPKMPVQLRMKTSTTVGGRGPFFVGGGVINKTKGIMQLYTFKWVLVIVSLVARYSITLVILLPVIQ